jgi:hypothetical protein
MGDSSILTEQGREKREKKGYDGKMFLRKYI